MKIRSGFVSNSSSSSFVAVIEKAAFEELKTQLDSMELGVLKQVTMCGRKKFMGNDVVRIECFIGNTDSFDGYTVKPDLSEGSYLDTQLKLERTHWLKQNPRATPKDIKRFEAVVLGELARPDEIWLSVLEKIKKLPADKVVLFEETF